MIVVLGHFIRGSHTQLGGQHIRTEMIYELIVDKYKSEKIVKISTATNKIKTLFYLIFKPKIKKVIMPGINLIKIICLAGLFHPKILNNLVIVAIGGWLPKELEERSWMISPLKAVSKIHVQLPSMREKVQIKGLNNVHVLPNFRKFDIKSIKPNNKQLVNGIRFVFLSRVCLEKGIDLAIDAIIERGDNSTLDIYGPIQKDYKESFFDFIAKSSRIKYLGVIPNSKVHLTLLDYDAMLFPTSYQGEGFPGVLLEAAYSGVYSIASDHLYNGEVIQNYCTGEVVKIDNFKNRVKNISLDEIKSKKNLKPLLPFYNDMIREYSVL